ncbi:ABC transporter substrate-binding protein [Salinibacterium sp. M195]|uniref:ABC transporter substrate-binding protein n=1 Tax=Salinibacterium sp. M195 TaxID=2583374 RepID=UPI001C62E3A4|nr:ABC transporter substrate-binding protein [Salinibacterium sp. M195]QYH35279.1 ABC transporter substrate-binding protein [Salinibacterium sp. M195]
MRTRRPLMLVATAAVVALLATACSGNTNDGSGGDSDSREASVQLYQAPTTFNPLVAAIGPNQLMGQLHWDGLLSVTADAEYGPRLAESWDVSEDGRTWTFNLRDDVNWSDGEAFTADDVVFTFNLYANPESGSAYAGKYAGVVGATEFADGAADSVAGFRAPDDYTFEIELEDPNVAFLEELVAPIFFILPEHIVGELPLEGLTDNQFFREPSVGIGPYIFEEWLTDDQASFVANPEYRSELGLDRVYARYLATDVAMAQLETGELDFAQVSAADFERMSGIDGITLQEVEGPGVMALHPALDMPPLQDPLVRQAIMHAVDREALVDEVLAGHGKVVDTLVHGPDWAVPGDLTHYDYDPEKARDLLAEANWDASTTVELMIVPGQRDRDTIMTIVAAQLQEVGINAVVEQVEPAEQGDRIGNRTFGTLLSAYGLFSVDPASMNARVMCEQIGGANLVAYCNPELDTLLKAGVATTDQSEREKIYAEAQHIMNEELPIMVLYVPNVLGATSDRLQGLDLNPLATDAFWDAAEWTVTD